MKAFLYSTLLLALPLVGRAQTSDSAPKPIALVTASSEQPKADPSAVTFSVEANSVSRVMRVRTNAKGPMQLEVNDSDGRPVLTKSLSANGSALSVPIGNLPDGSYIVRCAVGDKTFTRSLKIGQ